MEKQSQIDATEQAKPLEMTDSIIAQSILEHGICPLRTPIKFNGKTFDCVMRVRHAKLGDRIHAEKWSRDIYDDMVLTDAVRGYFIAEVCLFGELRIELSDDKKAGKVVTSANMKEEPTQLPVDVIIDMLDVRDYVNVSYLMGKN